MFSSFFSTTAPTTPDTPTLDPVSSRYSSDHLFGEIQSPDPENGWACSTSGFITETDTFYTLFEDGGVLSTQIIHSSVGLWYPTIQFTFKFYQPGLKTIWHSINVTNFTVNDKDETKRSSKSDQFTLTYKSLGAEGEYAEQYSLNANLSAELQISLEFLRPRSIPGFKIGAGSNGGKTFFGSDASNPEGFVTHRFWPRVDVKGCLIMSGQVREIGVTQHMESVKGEPGKEVKSVGLGGLGKVEGAMWVHAIQGMRPNLVASGWNFACFQSNGPDDSSPISAIQMEFHTLDTHTLGGEGSKGAKVNVGCLVVGGNLVCVTAETHDVDDRSKGKGKNNASHSSAVHSSFSPDSETSYDVPGAVEYTWESPGNAPGSGGKGNWGATLKSVLPSPSTPAGTENASAATLIEKLDVLAEIPYVIKVAVSYVAGTKPYVYQYSSASTLKLTTPTGEEKEVQGRLYNEVTFISK